MTVPSEHAEAKLHGFRRTQDGVVVSFVLHPQEVPQCLALDPLGTRFMLALARIGDDEHPAPAPQAPAGKLVVPKPSKPFHALPIGSQAALLCKDMGFWAYLAKGAGTQVLTEDAAAQALRAMFGVTSRRQIPEDAWRTLYAAFERWAGRVPSAD